MEGESGRGVAALKRWAVRSGYKVLAAKGSEKQERDQVRDRECLGGGGLCLIF